MNRRIHKFLIVLCFVFCFSVAVYADGCKVPSSSALSSNPILLEQFDELLDGVRDNSIGPQSAQKELGRLLPLLEESYRVSGGKVHNQSSWVFPLAGYGPKAVPGLKGKGFVGKGYDFFTGNRHGGHPAYDIFIRDRNQDDLDDRTLKPVSVLSMTGGMVISVESEWESASKLRGGKYIWVYDPDNDLLIYYAHNSDVFVRVGDVLQPGDKLATVGRTGLNAAKRRSPTHLHMTVLKARQGRPQAVRFWGQLEKAKTVFCQ